MKTVSIEKPTNRPRLTYSSKIIKTIISAILDKKGEEVISRIIKPLVKYKGEQIQAAQVDVSIAV